MTYTLLVVEDDAPDYALLSHVLNKSGIPCEVIRKENGLEALEYLRSLSPNQLPHLILSDLNMPKMTGIEFLRAIRRDVTLCHLPIVIQSTSREPQDIADAYTAGVNGYHVKEMDMHKYSVDVKNMLSYWLSQNIILKRD